MGLSGKKVLVSGADGFIGSHLAERLVHLGAKVSAMAFYNSFDSCGWLDTLSEEVRTKIQIIRSDIRDPHLVESSMRDCEVCFHLAALISIPFSYEAPEAYVQTNTIGTLNVLQAARRNGNVRVIHTSTSEVYGSAQYVPIDEMHPINAQSPYAASKSAADQLALSFHRSFDLPVIVVRPFNTYGPRQSARAIIPSLISQIAAGKKSISLGATHPTRDLSFVSDTVAGFIAAAESSQGLGEVVNLGSNFEISIGDLANTISKLMHADVEFISDAQRMRPEKSEVTRLWANNEKAQSLINWKPEYSGIEGLQRGLEKTITWFRDSKNLSNYHVERYAI